MLFYLSLWFVVIPIITINASFLNGFEINSQIIRECSLGRCDRCKASLKKWSECPARDCLFGLCMSNSTGNVYCPCTTINEPDNDFVETEKYDRYWVDPNDSCKTTTSPPDTTTCPLTTTSETTTICPITTTKEQPTTRQRKRYNILFSIRDFLT